MLWENLHRFYSLIAVGTLNRGGFCSLIAISKPNRGGFYSLIAVSKPNRGGFYSLIAISKQNTQTISATNQNIKNMPNIARLPIAAVGAAGAMIVETGEKTGSTEVTGCKAFVTLKAANEAYKVSLGKQSGSFDTDEVANADKQRDMAVVGIRLHVHSKTYWPDALVVQSAHRLKAVVDMYAAGIEDEAYNDESTLIHTFLTKLAEPQWQEDITQTEMQPLIDRLINTEQTFEQLQRKRAVTSATESEILAATKQRKALEKAIRTFMQYADAMNLVNPGTVWYNLIITIRQQLSEIERGHRNGGKPSQSDIDKG